METNNLSSSSSKEQDKEEETGQKNQGSSSTQELILGKFKSYDELAQSYKNLEAKLGELGQKAKKAEEVEILKTELEKMKAKLEEEGIEYDSKKESEQDDSRFKKLEEEIKEIKFLKAHPEIESNFELVKAIAKEKYKGSFEDALNDSIIKKILELEKKDQGKRSIIETNRKITSEVSDYQESLNKARQIQSDGKYREGAWREVLRKKGIIRTSEE